MIKSMTGYGCGESAGKFGVIKAEIKSVNNKFFDMGSKLPDGFNIFEDKIREYIQKSVKRGRVNLLIVHDCGEKGAKKVTLDRKLASFLLKEIKNFRKSERLKGEIELNNIIAFPGVLTHSDFMIDARKLWGNVKQALDMALTDLGKSRAREGRSLSKDLLSRIKKVEKYINAIKKRSNVSVRHYKKEFAKRIKELSGGIAIDKERLAQEVAIYAKNCDISEEITRIKSHAENFEKSLRAGGQKGKTLDFVAQELMREANTIGAKSSDFQISNHVIKIKSEIEKIREQARNIE